MEVNEPELKNPYWQNKNWEFGDYATVAQKRYGVPDERYVHKVIGVLKSNSWEDVPVQCPATETIHDHMENVASCICCGVQERTVLYYRLKDINPV